MPAAPKSDDVRTGGAISYEGSSLQCVEPECKAPQIYARSRFWPDAHWQDASGAMHHYDCEAAYGAETGAITS
jgi:hypothetical protein